MYPKNVSLGVGVGVGGGGGDGGVGGGGGWGGGWGGGGWWGGGGGGGPPHLVQRITLDLKVSVVVHYRGLHGLDNVLSAYHLTPHASTSLSSGYNQWLLPDVGAIVSHQHVLATALEYPAHQRYVGDAPSGSICRDNTIQLTGSWPCQIWETDCGILETWL